jgi:hypothetical protein
VDSFTLLDQSTLAARDEAGGTMEDFTPTFSNVPCKFVDKGSSPFEEYLQRDLQEKPALYLCNGEAYEAVTENDHIQFNGSEYRVEGKHDIMFLHVLYRLDLVDVITPQYKG